MENNKPLMTDNIYPEIERQANNVNRKAKEAAQNLLRNSRKLA